MTAIPQKDTAEIERKCALDCLIAPTARPYMPEEFVSLSSLSRHVEYEQAVAQLARRYYEEEGRPQGRALDHWLRAEKEILRSYGLADQSEEDRPKHA